MGTQLRSQEQEDHVSPVKGSFMDKSHRPRTGPDAVNGFKTKLLWHTPLASAEAGGSEFQGQSAEQVSGQGYTEKQVGRVV